MKMYVVCLSHFYAALATLELKLLVDRNQQLRFFFFLVKINKINPSVCCQANPLTQNEKEGLHYALSHFQ